jgi:RimJ/RimL family protein N-acetyltransferase
MLIRELKDTDFDDMVETYFSFYAEVEADPSFGLLPFHQRPTKEEEHKWLSETLRDVGSGNSMIRVAEVGSHVMGWCDVRRARLGSPIDHRGVLGICIWKEFRSRGVGTALMREVLEKCRGKFEIVELSVLASNPRAFKLYKRFGFKEIGVLPEAVKRSGVYIDERLMYLKL